METVIGGYQADIRHFEGEGEDSSLLICIRRCLYADLWKQKTFES